MNKSKQFRLDKNLKRKSSDPPPVGKLDKVEATLNLVSTGCILGLVVIHTNVENSSRDMFEAQKDAGENGLVVVVEVCDQSQGQAAGDLVVDPLAEDVHFVFQLSPPALVKGVVPEVIVQEEVCNRSESKSALKGVFES